MAKAIGPKSIDLLLGGDQLRPLSRQARDYKGPSRIESSSLPPALASRVTLLREEDTLLLLAENNAVAQLLRFHAPNLAREQGLKDWKVQVSRVALPVTVGPAESLLTPPRLSANAPACLNEAADAITDPDLKAALRRLASRT
ncbi:hypothetical protein K8B33_11215 [Alcanivorax sp. JB21]|uniref:hypothetical protein n=1 Tax=Alcanivorax limicola TaxID=2874102 RepID=UPI001CBABED0|nr:hypothetical protein [Alcanivorax limicola]MBZ2189669.1 hypothetical protein [Alcanivorax limicola]